MAKATEFDKLRKSRRRKRMFRRIVAGLIFLVFAGVCFVSSSFVYQLDLGSRLDNLRASLEGGDGFPVSMSDLTILNLLPMDGDVAVATTAPWSLVISRATTDRVRPSFLGVAVQ